MTKLELYENMLSNTMEQMNNNGAFSSKLSEMFELLKYKNALNGVSVQEAIANYCISAGVIATVNQFDLSTIDDPAFDLFSYLVQNMDVEIHNLKMMLTKPNSF